MPNRFRKAAVLAASVMTLSGVALSSAVAAPHRNAAAYDVALFGDQPYGAGARDAYPAVLADINAQHLAFSVFDGDIKNGSERCDTWQYDNAINWFNTLRAPVVYTPGDNEWTDCDRASAGSYDPNERLAYIRDRFFGTPHSLGQQTMVLKRQVPDYPENTRWVYGPVTWATINVTGSDNNFPQYDAAGAQVDGDLAEYTARNAANLHWLDESFTRAASSKSKAIIIVVQADMFGAGDPTAHFADTKERLAHLSQAFAGQVYLVNGDSHSWMIDHPLMGTNGQPLANVTRVTTDGSKNYGWTRATIDGDAAAVITFERHKLN